MSDTKITQADVDEILKLLASSEDLGDFHLKYGDFELRISRDPAGQGVRAGPVAAEVTGMAPAVPVVQPGAEPTATKADPPSGFRDAAIPRGMAVVKAPMVGTFYRAPSPGAKSFVEVGDKVEADSVVCNRRWPGSRGCRGAWRWRGRRRPRRMNQP